MRKLLVFLVLLMVVLALGQWVPASASESLEVSGTLSYIPYPVGEPKVAGGNTFFDTIEEVWWTGSLVGAGEDEGRVIVHTSGSWTYHATGHSTVTVNGRTGELTLRLNGRRPDGASDWTGTWVILSGGGELANLRGQGTFYGAGSPGFGELGAVAYQGQVHFAPAN